MKTFVCSRHPGNLTLTAAGCAAMWRRARASRCDLGDALYPCRGCEIGARHAGQPAALQDRMPSSIDRICVRCHRSASRFIWGRLCPSCYNRGLEVKRGRNAKGTRPVRAAPLYTVRIGVLENGVARAVVIADVTSVLEAELAVVRRSERRVAFVRTAPVVPVRQMTLFGGV